MEVKSMKTRYVIHTNQMEVVDRFMYFGVILNYNGYFNGTQKQFAKPDRRAIFCLRCKVSQLNLNEFLCFLFLTLI